MRTIMTRVPVYRPFMIRDPIIEQKSPQTNSISKLGESKFNNCGSYMQIIDFKSQRDMTVMIIHDGDEHPDYEARKAHYKNFKLGTIRSIHDTNNRIMKNRVGEQKYNSNGSLMTIIDYNTSNDIMVKIETDLLSGEHKTFIKKSTWELFRNGTVSSPYDRSVQDVGYLGEGPWDTTNNPIAYKHWKEMLKRGYHIKEKLRRITYKDVTVDPRFHNFQYFCEWHNKNYYEIENERMQLDKDILCSGNKVYSPETCCYVTNYMNSLVVKPIRENPKLPLGVSISNGGDKYYARLKVNKKNNHLGTFDTPEEAFETYRKAKKQEIKRVMDDYNYNKGGMYIPQFERIYNALLIYDVNIDE